MKGTDKEARVDEVALCVVAGKITLVRMLQGRRCRQSRQCNCSRPRDRSSPHQVKSMTLLLAS